MSCARSRAGSEINGHINDFSYPQDRRAQQCAEDDTDEQTEEYELVESVRPRPSLVGTVSNGRTGKSFGKYLHVRCVAAVFRRAFSMKWMAIRLGVVADD